VEPNATAKAVMASQTSTAQHSSDVAKNTSPYHSTPLAKWTSYEYLEKVINAMKKSQAKEEETPNGPGVQRDELGRVFV
jgi:hypothetical protein